MVASDNVTALQGHVSNLEFHPRGDNQSWRVVIQENQGSGPRLFWDVDAVFLSTGAPFGAVHPMRIPQNIYLVCNIFWISYRSGAPLTVRLGAAVQFDRQADARQATAAPRTRTRSVRVSLGEDRFHFTECMLQFCQCRGACFYFCVTL